MDYINFQLTTYDSAVVTAISFMEIHYNVTIKVLGELENGNREFKLLYPESFKENLVKGGKTLGVADLILYSVFGNYLVTKHKNEIAMNRHPLFPPKTEFDVKTNGMSPLSVISPYVTDYSLPLTDITNYLKIYRVMTAMFRNHNSMYLYKLMEQPQISPSINQLVKWVDDGCRVDLIIFPKINTDEDINDPVVFIAGVRVYLTDIHETRFKDLTRIDIFDLWEKNILSDHNSDVVQKIVGRVLKHKDIEDNLKYIIYNWDAIRYEEQVLIAILERMGKNNGVSIEPTLDVSTKDVDGGKITFIRDQKGITMYDVNGNIAKKYEGDSTYTLATLINHLINN